MMPKSLQISLFAVAVSAIGTSTIVAEEGAPKKEAESGEILLRFQFSEGESLRYQTVRKVTRRHVLPGGQRTEKSRVEQRRLFSVKDVSESGKARVTMQFEKVHMEKQTDDLEPQIFHTGMKPEEVPPYFKGVANNLRKAAPEFSVPAVGAVIDDEGHEVVPEGGHPCFVLPLPEKPIAVGDTWKVNLKVKVRVAPEIMRDVRLLRTLKLQSVEDGIAKISTATSIATRVKDPSTRAQLAQTTPQGTIHFDIAKGRVVKKELTSNQTVMGVFGKRSMLTAKCETIETLLPAEKTEVTSR